MIILNRPQLSAQVPCDDTLPIEASAVNYGIIPSNAAKHIYVCSVEITVK